MNENRNVSSEAAESSFLENIDYFTLLKDLLKNWWVILMAGAAVFFAVSCLPYLGYKPMYTASSTMIVTGTVRSGNSFSTYSSNAQSFVDILTDEYILQEVAEDMGLRKLDVEVSASVVADTNLISLNVRSDKPTTSYRVLKGLQEHYMDISEMLMPGYVLEELVPASCPGGPDNAYTVDQLRKRSTLIAMAVAAALILALSYFYDSVRNEKDVERKLDTRLMAAIYHERKNKTLRRALSLKKRKSALLITSPVTSFGFVESYRRLREKLVTRCSRSGKKIILITSMLENEGKSTVATNLALALAGVSDKVLLLDADLRKPAQYKIFEQRDKMSGSLSGFLRGKEALEDCLIWNEEYGLYMMYNQKKQNDSSELVSAERMKQLLSVLREQMDYIIIDTPPMELVADAEALAQYADYSLLVISPDHAPAKAVNDCIDQLNDCPAKMLGCILNNIYTVQLLVRQVTGIDFAGMMSSGHGKYGGYAGSYGYGYGYDRGYGKKEGYGNSSQENSKKKKKKTGHYREVASGSDFFKNEALKNDTETTDIISDGEEM